MRILLEIVAGLYLSILAVLLVTGPFFRSGERRRNRR
jgi:hypothetical protein